MFESALMVKPTLPHWTRRANGKHEEASSEATKAVSLRTRKLPMYLYNTYCVSRNRLATEDTGIPNY